MTERVQSVRGKRVKAERGGRSGIFMNGPRRPPGDPPKADQLTCHTESVAQAIENEILAPHPSPGPALRLPKSADTSECLRWPSLWHSLAYLASWVDKASQTDACQTDTWVRHSPYIAATDQ